MGRGVKMAGRQDRFDVDNNATPFLKRFTLAKAWVSHQEVTKSGYNDFTKANFYELADFIQPILDSQVKYDLFSCVTFDYENSIAKLTVYDAIAEDEKKLEFNFRFVPMDLSKGNALQAEGAIQTYSRRYLYLDAWEITESDFSEMDPDAKLDKKKKEQEEKSKAEAERKAKIIENTESLRSVIEKLGITEMQVVDKYNEQYPKKQVEALGSMPEVAIAGYLTLFEKKLAQQEKANES